MIDLEESDVDEYNDCEYNELLREVERLRSEVERLRVERAHSARLLVEAKKEGARSTVAERAAERAAVVAYLTGENEARCRFISDGVAMRIERGEHRRREKE